MERLPTSSLPGILACKVSIGSHASTLASTKVYTGFMKSHLVSQVVLKQFANAKREVTVHTRNSDLTELKAIDLVAYMEMDEVLIKRLEQKWGTGVEADAEHAINGLKNNNLVLVEKHVTTVKNLMALHFIRSQIFHLVESHKQTIDETFDQIKEAYSAAYPQYAESIERCTKSEHTKAPHEIAVKVMEKYIPMVEAYISDKNIGLEIGEAPNNAVFIIGDIPTITVDGDRNYGVPITEAKAFAMPLTPKHFVALKKNPATHKYKKMTAQQVQNANNRQLIQMVNEYYTS